MASPTSQERALHKALKERAFAPVYLLHGDEEFLKDDAVRRIVEAAVDPATRDFNLEMRRAQDLDGETLGSLLGTPPMMAERRVVVVRDVAALKKDAKAALDRYLQRPAPDCVVVLVAPAESKLDKALLDRTEAIEFKPLGEERLQKWIAHHARTVLDVEITPGAAALLMDAVGHDDLPGIACELEKLCSYVNGATIDEAAVEAIVGIRRGETTSDLLDAVAAREVRTALGVLPHVLSLPKSGGVPIVIALTTQFLALAWGRAQLDRGTGRNVLSKLYFDLLKETGAFPMRPWGEAVSAWVRYVERWTQPQLDWALDRLLEADCALKGSTVSDDEQVLTSLILALCAAPHARAA
jgi:DNA polymerase-3 subunit delta